MTLSFVILHALRRFAPVGWDGGDSRRRRQTVCSISLHDGKVCGMYRFRMEYLVSLTLLVAVGAWLAAAYARLRHLHSRVQTAWGQWIRATRNRNERLGDFLTVFSGFLPRGAMLPRDMRRWAEDSQRALSSVSSAPLPGSLELLEKAERHLRQMVGDSVHELERMQVTQDHEQLLHLCSEVSVSLFQQDQVARHYNQHAADYNHALAAPSGRVVAGLFGFSPVEPVD